MQRPPAPDTSLLERKMSADSARSGEGRSSWGSTEHDYDVFLSFRDSDTRNGIADHLYIGLPMGSRVGSRLLDAIVRYQISIPILSENHAASKWCRRELVQMAENGKSTGRVVVPVFDGVQPSHARNPSGSFEEAVLSHKMCFEQRDVEAGQQELRDVSLLKGWESEKIAKGVLKRFRPFVLREMAQMK